MKTLLYSALLAAALLTLPGLVRAEEAPIELPDSDTSSLGAETSPRDTPFMVPCTDAKAFNARMHSLEAKGMIVGYQLDGSLTMVFKAATGAMYFARSDKEGKTVCTFGAVSYPTVNLGVVLDHGGLNN